MVGLSRDVDRQTPGVLRELLVFYMSEAKLSEILLSLLPLQYLEMFQKMFFGFGDFCISFPRSIRPEPVFCSVTARSEWLVIACVPPWIRFWTVVFCFCFYHGGVHVLFLKSILRPGAGTNKTLASKTFVHFSPVQFLSPYVEMAQIMQSLSFYSPFSLHYAQPIQRLLPPQACLVEKGKILKLQQPILKLRRKGNLEQFAK